MSNDYRSMWADLGLDLAAHDMLLGILGEAYGKMYLTQANRPAGMSYFLNFPTCERIHKNSK